MPQINDALLTRFFILEPTDDTLTVWKHVGTVDARGREQAERKHYGDLREPVRCVTVSENAWRPRVRRPRVSAHIEPLTMPVGGASAEPSTPPYDQDADEAAAPTLPLAGALA